MLQAAGEALESVTTQADDPAGQLDFSRCENRAEGAPLHFIAPVSQFRAEDDDACVHLQHLIPSLLLKNRAPLSRLVVAVAKS